MKIRRLACCVIVSVLLIGSAVAHAAARASLQPDRITLGNTATLTIETDEVDAQPDFSVLDQSFIVRAQSSSVQTSLGNGGYSAKIAYSIEIEPRVEGVLTVPPIVVGSSTTESLSLTVVAPQSGSAEGGDPIFIESELSTTTPFVQQAVTYTVRLYYALPLLGGDVTAPAPANASLQQLGEDRQSQVEIGGRRYGVFERRYLLIPEQSGTLELPAARFRGNAQSTGGNGFFSRSQSVSAVGQAFTLEVRPQPANAPQPWLAVRALSLTRGDLPPAARVGEPLLVDVTLTADGATSTQLPDLELPPIAGAQVFPEPAQRQDRIVDGQPLATLRQRFAIVPTRDGVLELPELRQRYWNTESDRADVAVLAAASIEVAPGAAVAVVDPLPSVPAVAIEPAQPDAKLLQALRVWQWAAAGLSMGLLLALAWGWRRGRDRRSDAAAANGDAPAKADPALLRRALAEGDLQAIGDALRHVATPPCLNLGAVVERLADERQRDAVKALQRLQWAPRSKAEDHAEVRAALRGAFQAGPNWRGAGGVAPPPELPPLYPTV
jgi:hypothetical protein